MSENKIKLTKSKFLSGLQCKKKLFLQCFKKQLATPIGDAEQALIDEGAKIEELARKRFPGGCLIKKFKLDKALKETVSVLEKNEYAVIYEPTFFYDNIQVRSDILLKVTNDQFDLIEVKSTSKVKDEHEYDLGIQCYVIESSGLKIRAAYIMHLNPYYNYTGGDYNLDSLFKLVDLTDKVKSLKDEIILQANKMRNLLLQDEQPIIAIGKHCKKPISCQFFNYCIQGSEYPLTELPRISDNTLNLLNNIGITDISNIPTSFIALTDLQKRVRDAVVGGLPFFDKQIKEELSKLAFPIHFLDFETFNPALPLYSGTKPYQIIPFQWSDHFIDKTGTVEHREFLHADNTDPHKSFIASLLSALKSGGSVVVYSNFETSRIKEFLTDFPEFSIELTNILSRIIDLQSLIKRYCYYPEFHGSYSLKKVLPSIIPHLDYTDLEIADGITASQTFNEIMKQDTPLEQKEALRSRLLNYCKRDTEAMLELYRYFCSL